MSLTSLIVPRGKIAFPNVCPVCLSPNPTNVETIVSDQGKFSGYYVLFTTWKHLRTQIAFCADCARNERRLQRYSRATIIIGLLVAGIVIAWLPLARVEAGILGALFVAPGVVASELIGKPVRAGKYDAKTIELRFKNAAYAAKFRAMNHVIQSTGGTE